MPVSWVLLQVSPPSSLHHARMPGGCSSWKWLKSSWSTMTTTRPSFEQAYAGGDEAAVAFGDIVLGDLTVLEPRAAIVVAGEQHHDLVFERPVGVGVAVDQEQPAGREPDDVGVLGEAPGAAPDVEDPVRDRPCVNVHDGNSLAVWEKLPQSTPPRGGGRSALTESGYPAGPHVQPGRGRRRVRRSSPAGAAGRVSCSKLFHCVPFVSGRWNTLPENGTPGVPRVVSEAEHRGTKWNTGVPRSAIRAARPERGRLGECGVWCMPGIIAQMYGCGNSADHGGNRLSRV